MNKKIFVFFIILISLFLMCMSPESRSVFTFWDVTPTVVIDPGHGGFDGGAVGISGVMEKDLNLEISEKLCDMLTFLGANTHMTRSDDNSVHKEGNTIREKKVSDIKNRVDSINKIHDAFLISVHLNHFSMEKYSGAQVFYGKNEASKPLAVSVQDTLKYGVDNENKRTPQKAGNVYLLNNVNCPAILVECGFLSNKKEETLLKDEDYQRKLAVSIAVGFANSYKDVLMNEN
ncbi:MAG: N-acetylmuramoyl-L-alanine amidase [Clostridia bacterium]|nr:N-acetylmuramoyl-L-alanine amidase [Clostridia bacterium]